MSILIQNGILVLPTGPIQADLRVAGGRIAELGPGLAPGASRVIDAQERLVFPGFIDTHTHFEMNKGFPNETADDWYTGTRAALAGGTTTVLDFAEPERGATLASALETWHGRADGAACCNYGFHMTVKDWSPSIRSELREMTAAGVTSYKVYLAYDNLRLSDAAAYEVVKAVGAEGGVVGCHCENGDRGHPCSAGGRKSESGRPSPVPPACGGGRGGGPLADHRRAGGLPGKHCPPVHPPGAGGRAGRTDQGTAAVCGDLSPVSAAGRAELPSARL